MILEARPYLQKAAGVCALLAALSYVAAFGFFGAYWSYPANASSAQQLAYLAENHRLFSAVIFIMYVAFGVLLAVMVVALHQKFKQAGHALNDLAALFGAIWTGLVIASGMISTIGLAQALEIASTNAEKALDLWHFVGVISESLGGGNELVGGLWVISVSVVALQTAQLSRGLNTLGLLVGAAGIATVYPADVLTELFGVSQIVWFLWLGVVLMKEAPKPYATLLENNNE